MHVRQWFRRDQQGREVQWAASRGQILVMFAAGLFLLVGMIALAVDAGFLMAERRQVQNAADAGALAAARAKLDYWQLPGSQTAQENAGVRYATENADVPADNVKVNISPSPWGEDYVQVDVTKDVDMFFLRALYNGKWGVSATAIAGVEPVQLPYALVALNCPGIHISGSGTIDVNEGSVMSNCNITRDGQSSIVTSDGVIDANGTIDPGTLWYAAQGFRENRPAVPDPIVEQGVQSPSESAAKAQREVRTQDQLHQAVSGSTKHQSNAVRCSTTCTMQPGYYGGNLILDVRNSGKLQLQPGVYYFAENFRLEQQGSGIVEGTGVMMYFTDNARFIPHNGKVKIVAPETSPYTGGLDGMALWIANCTDFRLQANNSGEFSGVIYAPCSDVTLSGGPGAQGFQVVVGSLTLSGSGGFDILYEEFVLFDMPRVFLVQ